jgi:hypothetical protein
VELTIGSPGLWTRRALPVGCGAAMAGAAALVAMYDPAAPGTHFPGCLFHSTTGLWCPGCGLTRGFHQLLTGHPLAAMGENLFVPVVLVAVVASWAGWLLQSWGRTPHPWQARYSRSLQRSLQTVMPAALVLYGVLRNIPAAPFRSLAP